MKNTKDMQQGMAALLTIIIVGMATLAMVVTSSLLGMDQLDMNYSQDKSQEAFYLAESCVNDALKKIRTDKSTLPLDFSLPSDNGFCIIKMPDNNTILATGQAENYYKHLKITISFDGNKVVVDDWKEE